MMMNATRVLLLLSVLLNIALGVALVTVGSKAKRVIDGLIDYAGAANERRHDAIAASSLKRADIVFLGDSLTWEGSWDEYFPGQRVVNRGVGGDTTSDVLARLPTVLALEPKKIFIMVGINDLNFSKPVDEILASYTRIFDQLDAATQAEDIFVQSVLPTADKWIIDIAEEDIGRINEFLQTQSASRGYTYLDVGSVLAAPDGRLPDELTNDGIHLRGDAYRRWSDFVRPHVEG